MKSNASIKKRIKLRLIAAAIGFLIGDIIIGGLIWLIYSFSTGQWGTTVPIRMVSGLITGVICFIFGEKILFPAMDYLEKIAALMKLPAASGRGIKVE